MTRQDFRHVVARHPSPSHSSTAFIRLTQTLVVIVAACLFAKPTWALEDRAASPPGKLLFSIPVGGDGVHYAGVDSGEMPWGPASLAVAADGTIWVADTVDDSLLHYEQSGKFLGRTSLAGQVSAILHLVPMRDRLALLDYSPDGSRIILLSAEGAVISSHILAEDAARDLTNLLVDAHGDLILVHDGGVAMTPFMNYEGEVFVDGPSRTIDFVLPNQQIGAPRHAAFLTINQHRGKLTSAQVLGGVMVLAAGASDSYVLTEEVAEDGPFLVTQTVHHFDNAAREVGSAAAGDCNYFAYVAHGIAITPAGTVLALTTFSDHAEIRTLPFAASSTVSPGAGDVLGKGADLSATRTKKPSSHPSDASTGCVARSDMIAVVEEYLSNSHFVSALNLDIHGTSCPGRIRPRLFTRPDVYPSVAYAWGKFDTVAEFNAKLDKGLQVGDTNSSTPSGFPCTTGIDCSGLVSRAWGLHYKNGTAKHLTATQLVGISDELSLDQLLPGDIMDRAGKNAHAAIFAGNMSGGAMFYESTTTHFADRVILGPRPMCYFAGYTARRYKNVCDTPVISSIAPNPVPGISGDQTITIYGSNFGSGATVTLYDIGSGTGPYTVAATWLDSGQLAIVVDTGAEDSTWSAQVTNPDGTSSNVFKFPVQVTPSISSVSPSPVPGINGNQTITIDGSNFLAGATVTLYDIGSGTGPYSMATTLIDSGQLTIVANTTAENSTWSAQVTNPDGTASNVFDFSVQEPSSPAPSISSVSPNPVPGINGNQTITIYGSNFLAGATVTLFDLGSGTGPYTDATTLVDSGQLTIVANTTAEDSTWSAQVTNPGGATSNVFDFRVHTDPSINPTSQAFLSSGGSGVVSVTTATGQSWTAVSADAWITITSGASGTGIGVVGYSVAANNDSGDRTGTMMIAGLTFTITEASGAGSLSYQQFTVNVVFDPRQFIATETCTTTTPGCQSGTYRVNSWPYSDIPYSGAPGVVFYKCAGQWDNGTRSSSNQYYQTTWTYTDGAAVGQGVQTGSCSINPTDGTCPIIITLSWSVDYLGNTDTTASSYEQSTGTDRSGCTFTCTTTETHHSSTVWPVSISDQACPANATTCQECNPYIWTN